MKNRSPRSASVCASLPTVAALLAAGVVFAPSVGAQHNGPRRGGMRPAQPHTPPTATPPPVVTPPTPNTPPTTPTPPHATRPPDHPSNVRGGEGKVSLVPSIKDRA